MKSRPPTYGASTRVARIFLGLLSRPHGWRLDAICDEMRCSERTLQRYLRACREELVDAEGKPLLEIVTRGDGRLLRLADSARVVDSTAYQALSFYFALTVLKFLEGTILKDGVEDLWESFRRSLPPTQRDKLAAFDRKFYAVPYTVKDYREHDETLDVIVRSLVAQRTLRIEYAALWGDGGTSEHVFEPYTLVLYRGGLYLAGRSDRHGSEILYLAVERIRRCEQTSEVFLYPRDYSPAQRLQGTFGIIEGPPTRVVLRIHTDEAARLLSARQLHPSQRFEPRGDGTTLLTMTVNGTDELKFWVLGQGPFVEVVEPPGLRAEVAAMVGATGARYQRASPPSRSSRNADA